MNDHDDRFQHDRYLVDQLILYHVLRRSLFRSTWQVSDALQNR